MWLSLSPMLSWMWTLAILSPRASRISSICPAVLAWPTSKQTFISVPSRISESSAAVLPSMYGSPGMFSSMRTMSQSLATRSSVRIDFFAAATDFASCPRTARHRMPGWTVTFWAPSAMASCMVEMTSSTDASLNLSFIDARLTSLMGACTESFRP